MSRLTPLLLLALLAVGCSAPPEAAPAPHTPDPALGRARAAVGDVLDHHADAESLAAAALGGFRAIEGIHVDLTDADRFEDAAQRWDDVASRWAASREALERLVRARAETRASLVPARRALTRLEDHEHEAVARYASTELAALAALDEYLTAARAVTGLLLEHEDVYAHIVSVAASTVEPFRSGDTTRTGAASTYRTEVGEVLDTINGLNEALAEAEARRALHARAAQEQAQAAQRAFATARRPPRPDDA